MLLAGVWGCAMTALLRESLKYILVIALFIVALATVNHLAYQRGSSDALLAVAEQQNSDKERDFSAFQEALHQQFAQAQQWNERLSNLLTERAKDNAHTTKELKDALKKTQATRQSCQLDDDVMQQLNTAQARAASAARDGFTRHTQRLLPRPETRGEQ